jgi:hypothetical protein
MSDSEPAILFEVMTPLGFTVRCTEDYWKQVISVKHIVMAERLEEVMQALSDPDEVRQSRFDAAVLLFYRADEKRWVCVVARRLNGDGFLITSYPTDAIKEGEQLWKKSR